MVLVMADLTGQQIVLLEISRQNNLQRTWAEALAQGVAGNGLVVSDEHGIKCDALG